ncbi:MAG: carbon starvation CstA family protein [Sulfurifustis sp.]
MNVLYLMAAMATAFVFGYRFYAKLLALGIFRLDKNYSTPAQARADGNDYVPTHPHLLFGHHIAAVGGGALFAAPVAAAAWGWVPAFLWIIAGTTVAAGTYGLGSFWLSLRVPKSLRATATDLLGRHAARVLLLFAVVALLILVAAAAGMAAVVLAANPLAALPVIVLALIAIAFGSFLHGRAEFELLPASVLAFGASLLVVWLLDDTSLAFNGALVVSVGGLSLSIEAVLVWVVLLLVYAFHAARMPIWRLMRPRGFLTTLLLGVALVIFYVAAAVEHPVMVAPQFHSTVSISSALPWVLLVVGPGALAGWQLLLIHGVTAREMRRETDARYIGYGAALVQGVIALSALLIATTGVESMDEWARQHPSVPAATDFPQLAAAYIDGFGRYAAALRLDPLYARTLAAVVVASLALGVLEAAVRALKHLLAETPLTAPNPRRSGAERARLWTIVVAGGLLALDDGRGLGGLAAWPILALLSLWIAAGGFALVTAALRVGGRSAGLFALLGAAAAAVALWGSAAQLWLWFDAGAWAEFAVGALALLAGCVALQDVLRRPGWRKPARA